MTTFRGWYSQDNDVPRYWDGEQWLDNPPPEVYEAAPGMVTTNHAPPNRDVPPRVMRIGIGVIITLTLLPVIVLMLN